MVRCQGRWATAVTTWRLAPFQFVDVDRTDYIRPGCRSAMLHRLLGRSRAAKIVCAVDALKYVLILQESRDNMLWRRLSECLARCCREGYMRLEGCPLGHGDALLIDNSSL